MAMMETIRRGTDSTIMKVIFGAIVLVFVFWGVTPQGNRGQLIAEVNGERITDTEYRRMMGRLQGTSNMDDDELSELGRQVVQELIRQRVQIQEAERVGLVVSIQEIAREIRKTEAFQTEDGKFSEKVYASVLKHSGMSKGQYEEQLRERILQQKLQQLAATSVQVSDAEVQRYFEASFTDVTVAWVRLADDDLLAHVPVEDAEVAEWITTHPDELKEEYDKAFNTRWSKPRRLDVSTILLRTDLDQGKVPEHELQDQLKAIQAQAAGGADFAELARRWSEDLASVEQGGRLGFQTEVQLGEDLAKAALAAGPGGVTEVVQTARGLQIAKVHEVVEPVVIPLEEAQDDIARERLARGKVGAFAGSLAERIQAAWTDPAAPPTALLDEHGLTVVTSGPFKPAQPRLVGLGASPTFEAAIAGAKAPGVLPGVYPTLGGRVVGAVTDLQEPDPAMMDTMRDFIFAQLLSERRQEFLERYSEDLVARAKVENVYQP